MGGFDLCMLTWGLQIQINKTIPFCKEHSVFYGINDQQWEEKASRSTHCPLQIPWELMECDFWGWGDLDQERGGGENDHSNLGLVPEHLFLKWGTVLPLQWRGLWKLPAFESRVVLSLGPDVIYFCPVADDATQGQISFPSLDAADLIMTVLALKCSTSAKKAVVKPLYWFVMCIRYNLFFHSGKFSGT